MSDCPVRIYLAKGMSLDQFKPTSCWKCGKSYSEHLTEIRDDAHPSYLFVVDPADVVERRGTP